MPGERRDEFLLAAGAVAVSACVWLALGKINQALSTVTEYAPGVDLVYLPAGVRLGLILLFRLWGAIGITLSNPLLFAGEFGGRPALEIATNCVITGFVPLLTVIAICWILRIDSNLASFKPSHLPLIALAVSLTAPIAFNITFVAFGYKSFPEVFSDLSAMVLGDFLGCLIVLLVMRTVIRLCRSV